MTDGFERKDMNTNDSEQVQSFSTADNTQQATGTSANTEAQASYTSGAANNSFIVFSPLFFVVESVSVRSRLCLYDYTIFHLIFQGRNAHL